MDTCGASKVNIDIAQELSDLASSDGVDAETQAAADALAKFDRQRTERSDRYLPDEVLQVDDEWRELYQQRVLEGIEFAARSHVTICGMARNIAGILPVTISRLKTITDHFSSWGVAIVENDSTDDTKAVLASLEEQNPGRVVCHMQDYNWPHLHGWEPERVQRYAMLRNTYREMARDHWPHSDVVLCVDLDCWGGWSIEGLLNGLGWLNHKKSAACMASTSLFQHQFFSDGPAWGHYDCWALRVHGWKHVLTPWKTFWLPPVGAPPIKVFSAFGAAALYRPEAFFKHAYESIDGDIEHAGLHRSMIEDGWKIYLNPAQRSLMHWLTEEHDAGRHHSD